MELLLYLLFGKGLRRNDRFIITVISQTVNHLIDNGGVVGLVMVTKGVGGDGWLTLPDVLLGSLEVGLGDVCQPLTGRAICECCWRKWLSAR